MSAIDSFLNLAARLAIMWVPPLEAKRYVERLCAPLPSYDLEQGRGAFSKLHRGTCLSRAIAIAARVPNAEVVIGVNRESGRPFGAHAWIEVGGQRIGDDDHTTELARFR